VTKNLLLAIMSAIAIRKQNAGGFQTFKKFGFLYPAKKFTKLSAPNASKQAKSRKQPSLLKSFSF